MTNRERSKRDWFVRACLVLGIKATKRQASKYKNGKGSLFNTCGKITKN